jgi:hypothetical protein
MSTPLGHSIVGYTLARIAGVKSPGAMALAVGAANLPDVDLLLGYVANGDLFSLHHEVITHKPPFPLLVGAGVGALSAAVSVARGRKPRVTDIVRPAALATALVGSHVVMDRLPLPYDNMPLRAASFWEAVVSQAWNAVIDMASYGTLAAMLFERGPNGRRAEA